MSRGKMRRERRRSRREEREAARGSHLEICHGTEQQLQLRHVRLHSEVQCLCRHQLPVPTSMCLLTSTMHALYSWCISIFKTASTNICA